MLIKGYNMLSSKEFFSTNEETIKQEIDAILSCINDRIAKGYCHIEWTLDYAPAGALALIELAIKEEMSNHGWLVDSNVAYRTHKLVLDVSPDVSSHLGL